jgi:hypothetical protein
LAGDATVSGCSISGNELNGLLLADNAHLVLRGGRVSRNEGYGVYVKDGRADVEGNTFERNGRGPWFASENADVDLVALSKSNTQLG